MDRDLAEESDDSFSRRLIAVTAESGAAPEACAVERSIASLLRLVREQLDLEVIFVGEFVEGRRVFRHIAARDGNAIIKIGESHPIDETACLRILDGRMPRLVHSVARIRVQQGLPDYYDALGAHIGVPLRCADGRYYGMLCGFSFGPCEQIKERDVRRLEIAAENVMRLLAQADGLDVGV